MSEPASPTPDDAPFGDPGRVIFHEKLVPGAGMWIFVALTGVASFAVGAPINIPIAIVAGIIVAATLGLILYSSSPVLEVTEDSLQVGRAHIEREFVGEVEVFRGENARIACGPAADGRAFMNFRPWVSPVARIHITDPADPTPYWLTNSRRPEEFALALGSDPAEQTVRTPLINQPVAETDEEEAP
ncbi:DUF3093 domain-containing protein [uncultured Kocuria sp.]|uniref:DUF3093 domain-containing protein n=1 Tax=uncultured Kocuria sp. TaxID=259305 RepID=UPI0025953D40|nr:DUF3093 domain-containing protein [uncultured Kocuria sp.]